MGNEKKVSFRRDFAILTLSDKGSRGERMDTSGAWLRETLQMAGYKLQDYTILPDQEALIVEKVIELVDTKNIALIITTGGTGLSPTDRTPEAMDKVLEKDIPGIAEAMRAASMLKTNRAMLSRGRAGIRGESLIINLPGSLKAVKENLEVFLDVLPHALEKIQGEEGDCGMPA
ncbi:MAG: MogA/MoaB family molybdenum cofactor biosynthesis protein [Desulforhopalus sp.]|nr:MogA/MoaB family molybdenum cofactor biosynthesis protein [Desulforhopalus sp.]